jgi:hypothetical protein
VLSAHRTKLALPAREPTGAERAAQPPTVRT